MSRRPDSGYARPEMNEHESQRGPMLTKGIKSVKQDIAAWMRSEAKRLQDEADRVEGKTLMNTTSSVSATNPLVETEVEEPVVPTAENPLIEITDPE